MWKSWSVTFCFSIVSYICISLLSLFSFVSVEILCNIKIACIMNKCISSQRGHLFFGISPRGEISQEGFVQGLVSPPATSRYIGSVRIISEAPLVCPNGCWYLLKDGGLVFHNLVLHKDIKLE
jgi:hypothetical protein